MTVVVGVLAKWWIPNWPESAKFLTEDERTLLVSRLAQEGGEARMDHMDKRAARRILTDVKIYFMSLAYFGVANTGYAGSVSSS